MVFARVLQFLSARQHARDRRRDHRNSDGLAVSLLRDALLSSNPQGLFPTRRALDRRAQAASELFDAEFRVPEKGEPISYILTEFEPVFDAADFFRCGRDLFVIRSNVTNASGIEWLRRHLKDGYCIHEIESRCPNPMHIDTTILPLGPGKILINPEYLDVDRLPAILKKWDILVAPEPNPITDRVLSITSLCGKWLSMNILMIDEKRVIVDPHHSNMIRAM